MPHLTTHDAAVHHMHGVTFTAVANSATGTRQLAAWRADFSAQTPGQPHTMSREELLLVLSGRLDVEVDDDRFTAAAGDAVLVPAGARFRVSNTTDEPAAAWVTTTVGMTAQMLDGTGVTPPWAQ